MEQDKQQPELTPEELKQLREKSIAFYKAEIAYLEIQVKYEDLRARIQEARLRRTEALVKQAELFSTHVKPESEETQDKKGETDV